MKQQFQSMSNHLQRQTNSERLGIVRNTFLAGAALSTAILVALTQVGTNTAALKVAAIGCSISAPIWLCLAAVIELYLHLGEEASENLHQLRISKTYAALQFIAGVSLYLSLCGLVYFLLPFALFSFILFSVISAIFLKFSYLNLAKNWGRK